MRTIQIKYLSNIIYNNKNKLKKNNNNKKRNKANIYVQNGNLSIKTENNKCKK